MSASWTDDDDRKHQADVEASAPEGMRPKLWNFGEEPAFKAHLVVGSGWSDERCHYERYMRDRIPSQRRKHSALGWVLPPGVDATTPDFWRGRKAA